MTAVSRRSAVPRPARFERPRTALLTQLSETLDVPLVVLSAPTGYGKTTLLAQYARVTPRRVAWVRVTDEHEGPVSLLTRLAVTLPELAPLGSADPRTPPATLLQQLITLLSDLDDGVDLIVDNVSSETQRRWLAHLTDALEEGHRLLISTYSTDGLRLARRLADGQAVVLDAADLAFTAAEVSAYLRERGEPVTATDLHHLGGWPAGLALAASGASRHAAATDLVLDALATLPPEVGTHLCALAPLDVWTEADATVLAPDLPPGWLLTVQRAGLPILALGQGAFRPHGLLMGVLDTQLRRDSPLTRRSHERAAHLAAGRGDAERAAILYLQAGDPDSALQVAAPLVAVYRDRGEHHRTRALLEAFGPQALGAALQERLAWAQIETGASMQGEAILTALHAAGQLSGAGLASLAMLRGRQGDTAQQYALSREGLALDGALTPALFWPFVQAALRLGHLGEAEEQAARLRRWALREQDAVRQAEAWHLQALVWRQTRTPAEAAQALARAREAYESLGWQGRAAALHLDELELAVRAGDWSEETVLTLSALAGRLPPEMPVLHLRRLNLLGAVQVRLGQPAAAERTLRAALTLARDAGVHPASAGCLLTLADALLAQGQAAEALDWLQEDVTGTPSLLRTLLLAQAADQPCVITPEQVQAEPDAYVRERARRVTRGDVGGAATDAPLAASAPPTFPLRLVTLGDCRATLNGHVVKLGLAKARELLAWLALHPSGSRDELVTALWDGSAEDRHVEYFRVTVRRLRSALREHLPEGLDPLPYADGRYRLSDHLRVSVDALEPPHHDALKPFLPGVETEWAELYREDHVRRVSQALLAEAATATPEQAAVAYQALLNDAPLLTEAHEGLIRTLHRLGETARLRLALSTYERLLREEYGAPLPADLRHLGRATPDGEPQRIP